MSGRILTRRLSSVSPYEVDPFSWFTGPLVPLVFAAINLLYGATQAVLTWIQIGNPRLQFSGVILTTVTDVMGFLSFLGLATLVLLH